jgi:hypothetical protein
VTFEINVERVEIRTDAVLKQQQYLEYLETVSQPI